MSESQIVWKSDNQDLKKPHSSRWGTFKGRESKWLYLIHRNKHREADKMRRQRHMAQMKEQNKTPEKELNKTEIANLSDES